MSIKKKVEIDNGSEERKRQMFISKGGQVASDKSQKSESTSILVRIPIYILNALDHVVKRKPWSNRTQWIMDAISDRLEKEL